jgi:hypothetical protein
MTSKLTPRQAADEAGCTESYIRRQLRAGNLSGERVSERCWLVDRAAVEQLSSELSSRAKKNQKKT